MVLLVLWICMVTIIKEHMLVISSSQLSEPRCCVWYLAAWQTKSVCFSCLLSGDRQLRNTVTWCLEVGRDDEGVTYLCDAAPVKHFETLSAARQQEHAPLDWRDREKRSAIQWVVCVWKKEARDCELLLAPKGVGLAANPHNGKTKRLPAPPRPGEACGRSAVVLASDERGPLTARVCGSPPEV